MKVYSQEDYQIILKKLLRKRVNEIEKLKLVKKDQEEVKNPKNHHQKVLQGDM